MEDASAKGGHAPVVDKEVDRVRDGGHRVEEGEQVAELDEEVVEEVGQSDLLRLEVQVAEADADTRDAGREIEHDLDGGEQHERDGRVNLLVRGRSNSSRSRAGAGAGDSS